MKTFWIIGNWKMYFSFNQADTWLKEYAHSLHELSSPATVTVAICPSFDALSIAQKYLNNSSILWGAQTCSPALSGAYTGQVSPQSLLELGCQLCLVGHSEARTYLHESHEKIQERLALLLAIGIRPVLCIGETAQERSLGKTIDVLKQQLSVLEKLSIYQEITPLIAYEPTWAIGTGKMPTTIDLQNSIDYIKTELQHTYAIAEPSILYGGSVSEKHTKDLCSIKGLDGFLIGKASTNFQELKNIVVLVCNYIENMR